MTGQMKRLEVVVHGMVQGVGYRYFVQMAAIGLHLNGRVCNVQGGAVKIIAEGDKDTLEQLISALWQGPRSAHVESISETWGVSTGEFTEFAISHSDE